MLLLLRAPPEPPKSRPPRAATGFFRPIGAATAVPALASGAEAGDGRTAAPAAAAAAAEVAATAAAGRCCGGTTPKKEHHFLVSSMPHYILRC